MPEKKRFQITDQQNFLCGLLFIATGLGFAIGATSYSFGNSARPGPGYFPFGLGLLLAAVGALMVVNSILTDKPGPNLGKIIWRPLIVITTAIVVFGITLPLLGIILALPLLILIVSAAGDEFHWGEVAINALILTSASWAIFVYGLGLVLPVWPSFIG